MLPTDKSNPSVKVIFFQFTHMCITKDKTLAVTTESEQPIVQCIMIALDIESYRILYKS